MRWIRGAAAADSASFAWIISEGWLANRNSFIKEGGPPTRLSTSALARYGGQAGAMVGNLRVNHERRLVDQNIASWNRVVLWMRQLESLSRVS